MLGFTAFSDLQVHPYRAFDRDGSRRLSDCLQVIDLSFETAASYGDALIVFPGDMFDMPMAPPTRAVNGVLKTLDRNFKRYPDTRLLFLPGNHDYATKALPGKMAEHALEMLPIAFPQHCFDLSNTSRVLDNVLFLGVPFYEYAEHYYAQVEAMAQIARQSAHPSVLLTHATMAGFEGIPGDIDPNHACFSAFDLVICGDIHHPRVLSERMVMLGNPLHRVLSDAGDAKGIWHFQQTGPRQFGFDFLPTAGRFPQFRRLREGQPVPAEWEKDYIVREPVPVFQDASQAAQFSAFTADRAPGDLVRAYWEQQGGGDAQLLERGLGLL